LGKCPIAEQLNNYMNRFYLSGFELTGNQEAELTLYDPSERIRSVRTYPIS